MSPRWWFCWLILALRMSPAVVQSDSTVEEGSFRIHKFKQPIGEERYRIVTRSDGTRLTTRFQFTDRGTPVVLDAALAYAPGLTPVHFEIAGKVSRHSTIDVAVDMDRARATIRSDSTVRDTATDGPAFPIAGYAPIAIQQALLRYWIAHGRPDSIGTLPGGWAKIVDRGKDTVPAEKGPVVLSRFSVEGVIWGRETLWLDAADRLVAAVTIDAEFDHLEAIREGYEGDLASFVERAAADGAETMAEAVATTQTGDTARSFALIGATLIDGTGAPPISGATVLIRDGRIVAAGSTRSVTIPPGVERVDVTGRTVLPGLWDMHAHYEQVEWGPIYLAAGVTTARDVGNEFEFITAVRDAIDSGRGIGPRLVLAGIVDGNGPRGAGVDKAGDASQAVRIVRRYHAAGFRQMKIYSSISLPVLRAVAREAHRLGMTVTGHVPEGLDVYQAVGAGMDQVNHITYIYNVMRPRKTDSNPAPSLDLNAPRARAAIAFLRDHHVVLDPTLGLFELFSHPTRLPFSDIEPGISKVAPALAGPLTHAGVSPEEEKEAARRFADVIAIVGALHRAGVTIVAGTDQGVPGHSLHRELELYVKAGFTPMEAIEAATSVPARVLGLDDETGTLTAGKRADLIVIDGDPLADITNTRRVRLVVTNGKRYLPAPLWRSVGFKP
ncbi:MAG TPA: amidohydrolase family protein [Gemmatimonadales bacterium]